MSGYESDNFYWAKIRYFVANSPPDHELIRWEVLHYEDDRWWAAGQSRPYPEDHILKVGLRLERPSE